MKKEWFEPGSDGESPFVRKYNASPGTAGEAIAAAFRALLAEDESVGNVVPVPEIVTPAVAECIRTKDAEIARLTAERDEARDGLDRTKLALNTTREQRNKFWSQRDAARAEVDRWKSRADAHEQNYNAMLRRVDEVAAERDDLQARMLFSAASSASRLDLLRFTACRYIQ